MEGPVLHIVLSSRAVDDEEVGAFTQVCVGNTHCLLLTEKQPYGNCRTETFGSYPNVSHVKHVIHMLILSFKRKNRPHYQMGFYAVRPVLFL